MSGETLEYALAYHRAGLSVVPLRYGTKEAAVPWKKFTERPQTQEELPALFSGEPHNIALICGSVSHNLAVLDVDSREKWAELDCYPVFRKLKACSPVVRTYRGYHVYLQAPFPLAAKSVEKWKTDVLAEHRYAVAPPSEVRREHGAFQLYLFSDGVMRPIYAPRGDEWAELSGLFGLVPYEDIAIQEASYLFGETSAGGIFYGLGPRAMSVLLEPESVGYRSEAEQIAVFRAVSIGWTFSDVLALFRSKAARGTKFRQKEAEGYGEKWLLTCYKRALAMFRKQVSERWMQVSAAIDLLAEESPFSGRTRYTDAAVLRLLLQIEREAGRSPFRASYRLIAERIGRPLASVFDAIERLQEAGAVVIQKADAVPMFAVPQAFLDGLLAKPNKIDTFSLGNGGDPADGLLAKPNKIDTFSDAIGAGNDAYRQKALGSPGPHLVATLNQLHAENFTISDLMRRGFAFRYVERVLPLLMSAGIVELAGTRKPKHGRPQKLYKARRIGFGELDRIAEAAGTAGEGEKQNRQYKDERLKFAARFS